MEAHGTLSATLPAATGEPSARVLVIPGLDGHTTLLEATAPHLFRGMQPRVFDHTHDAASGGAEGLAERALALLDADGAEEEPVFVCGESFGGLVALTLARRFPHRVRGLLLFSTFASYPQSSALAGRLGMRLWDVLGDEATDRVLRAVRPFGIPGALGLRFPLEVLRMYLGLTAPDLSAYRAKCQLALDFDARPWLSEIQSPAFVLTGSWDPVVPVAAGRELASRLPRADLVQMPGGHLVYAVRARQVGHAIGRWATGLDSSHRYAAGSTDRLPSTKAAARDSAGAGSTPGSAPRSALPSTRPAPRR